jgi:hypothetical protein
LGNLEEGSSIGEFERWMKGALWMKRLSLYEESPWRGFGGAPSLGTLKDMLRKSLDMGISHYGGPFPVEGNPVCEGFRAPATLLDGWRRVLVVGHFPVRDSMKGTLGRGFLYWGTRKMRFLRDLQDSL